MHHVQHVLPIQSRISIVIHIPSRNTDQSPAITGVTTCNHHLLQHRNKSSTFMMSSGKIRVASRETTKKSSKNQVLYRLEPLLHMPRQSAELPIFLGPTPVKTVGSLVWLRKVA